jgi:hypothetical protein
MKSRRIGWVVHVAHMGEVRTYIQFCLESLKGRDHVEELGIDGMILNWILWR